MKRLDVTIADEVFDEVVRMARESGNRPDDIVELGLGIFVGKPQGRRILSGAEIAAAEVDK